jgi:hypothetical protein
MTSSLSIAPNASGCRSSPACIDARADSAVRCVAVSAGLMWTVLLISQRYTSFRWISGTSFPLRKLRGRQVSFSVPITGTRSTASTRKPGTCFVQSHGSLARSLASRPAPESSASLGSESVLSAERRRGSSGNDLQRPFAGLRAVKRTAGQSRRRPASALRLILGFRLSSRGFQCGKFETSS